MGRLVIAIFQNNYSRFPARPRTGAHGARHGRQNFGTWMFLGPRQSLMTRSQFQLTTANHLDRRHTFELTRWFAVC